MTGDADGWWEPDPVVTEAVLQGRMRIGDLSTEDTNWVVAELSSRRRTVAEIARALGCTPRHVKRVRARPVVRVMRAFAEERARAVGCERRALDAEAMARRVVAERDALERANYPRNSPPLGFTRNHA